jgi:hypothetical protein
LVYFSQCSRVVLVVFMNWMGVNICLVIFCDMAFALV